MITNFQKPKKISRREFLKFSGIVAGSVGASQFLGACQPSASTAAPTVISQTGGWLRKWDGVTINLSTWEGPPTVAYKILADKFSELTGAKVNLVFEGWADLLGKHMAEAAAHTGTFDLLTWPYIWNGHYVEGKVVEDLNPWFENKELVDPNYHMEDWVEAVLNGYGRYFTDPKALWAVPFIFDVWLATFRKDKFKEAGIVDAQGNAKAPETWDELKDVAGRLKKKFPDESPLIIPLAVDDSMVSTFLPTWCSYGGSVPNPWFDENLYPRIHEETAIQAINVIKDMLPYMPIDATSVDQDPQFAMLQQGLVTYGNNYSSYYAGVVDPAKSKIADVIGFALTPGGPSGRYQGLGGWQVGLASDSKNKEAAFQLLQFLTNYDNAIELALAGGAVARKIVVTDERVVKAFPFYPIAMEALGQSCIRGSDRSWSAVQLLAATGLSKILTGEDPKKTLYETSDQIFNEVQKAGYHPEKTGPAPQYTG
jgi:multiple sugar transport system substrate-binding protein